MAVGSRLVDNSTALLSGEYLMALDIKFVNTLLIFSSSPLIILMGDSKLQQISCESVLTFTESIVSLIHSFKSKLSYSYCTSPALILVLSNIAAIIFCIL